MHLRKFVHSSHDPKFGFTDTLIGGKSCLPLNDIFVCRWHVDCLVLFYPNCHMAVYSLRPGSAPCNMVQEGYSMTLIATNNINKTSVHSESKGS